MGVNTRHHAHKNRRKAVEGLGARLVACNHLYQVIEQGMSLNDLLAGEDSKQQFAQLSEADRKLAFAILLTALRHNGHLTKWLKSYVKGLNGKKLRRVRVILLVALAQIMCMEVADHAAVHLAVENARNYSDSRPFTKLINGVLRSILRDRKTEKLLPLPMIELLPAWIVRRWQRFYSPEQVNELAECLALDPSLDINIGKEKEHWQEKLDGLPGVLDSLRLPAGSNVENLPGFTEGKWWVQDEAAAIACHLFGNIRDKVIADLCAAPGGKTAQLLVQGANVTAVDISANRLQRLRNNMKRLKLSPRIVEADLLEWMPSRLFDSILLDAPCSATGTFRRNPDVLWLRNNEQIRALVQVQRRLLARAIEWLKPGGTLIYCVCSLEPEEGEQQAEWLAENHNIAAYPVEKKELEDKASERTAWLTSEGYLRIMPQVSTLGEKQVSRFDGFFIARFTKPN